MNDYPRVYSELLVKKLLAEAGREGEAFTNFLRNRYVRAIAPSLFIIRDNYIL